MIKTNKEAELLCEKFGVKISEHPHAVVTANGNVYLTDNVDPKDTSERFYMNTEDVNAEIIEEIEQPKKKKKQL